MRHVDPEELKARGKEIDSTSSLARETQDERTPPGDRGPAKDDIVVLVHTYFFIRPVGGLDDRRTAAADSFSGMSESYTIVHPQAAQRA